MKVPDIHEVDAVGIVSLTILNFPKVMPPFRLKLAGKTRKIERRTSHSLDITFIQNISPHYQNMTLETRGPEWSFFIINNWAMLSLSMKVDFLRRKRIWVSANKVSSKYGSSLTLPRTPFGHIILLLYSQIGALDL